MVSRDFDRAAKEQGDHEELAQQLWIKRLFLREQRRESRKQREKTHAAEARLASDIRRFSLRAEPLKHEQLLAQFSEVQMERDAPGVLDVDYDEAEDQYDAQE